MLNGFGVYSHERIFIGTMNKAFSKYIKKLSCRLCTVGSSSFRLECTIILLTLDFSNISNWKFSSGSVLVLAACCCWGLENNCTRNISEKSPAQIVVLKGLGFGLTALIIAFIAAKEVNITFLNIIYACIWLKNFRLIPSPNTWIVRLARSDQEHPESENVSVIFWQI